MNISKSSSVHSSIIIVVIKKKKKKGIKRSGGCVGPAYKNKPSNKLVVKSIVSPHPLSADRQIFKAAVNIGNVPLNQSQQ